jgi:hypothetical protein
MTVSAQTSRNASFAAPGATAFPYGFKILSSADLLVTVNGVTKVLGADYTVSGVGQDTGGDVTFLVPMVGGERVLRSRNMAFARGNDYQTLGDLHADTLNKDCDAPILMLQQLLASFSLAMRAPADSIGVSMQLPYPEANKLLGWAPSLDKLQNFDVTGPADLTLRTNLATPGALQGANLIGVQDASDYFVSSVLEQVLVELAVYMPFGTGAVAQRRADELRRVVRPEHYGAVGNGIADDTPAMQAAVLAAAGKTLQLTPGATYLLNSGAMRVKSKTKIIAYGATIKRGSGTNRFITWDTDGVTGSYDAVTDVTILGGIWDGGYPTIATSLTGFGICHSRRTRIHDCYMKNVALNHYIEINSSSDVVITGCTFEGGAEQADDSMEAIQIDGAIDSATFSGGAPYDLTFCSNITIANNNFNNCGTGIGTHSTVSGSKHTHIRITGNHFTTPWFCGVRVTNWDNTVISGNVFYGGLHAVRAFADVTTIMYGLVITGNIMQKIGQTTKDVAGNGHAIYLSGNSAGTESVQRFTITGNTIYDMGETKSGSAIKINYCGFGLVSNNAIDGMTNGNGIVAFTCQNLTVNGNEISNISASFKGISLSSMTTSMIDANRAPTIDLSNSDKTMVRNNITSAAASITGSGNTNGNVSHNLQGSTFA